MRRPGTRVAASLVGAIFFLVIGCSSNSDQADVMTIEPAVAALSPLPSATPAGVVHPIPRPIDSTTFDPDTRSVVVLADGGTRVLLLSGADLTAPARQVSLDKAANQVTIVDGGVALLAMNGQVGRLDLRTGALSTVPVSGDVRSVAQLDDGGLAAGLANGEIHIIDTESTASQVISGLASVDALAVTGTSLTALDRRQTSLTAIDTHEHSLGVALRAGEGAAQLTTDRFDRILVTDTTGDELLVYTTDTLMLRQRYPVGPAPYAIAYDEGSDRAWVTLTGSNEVVGYELSSGIPVESTRFPTVRQPNSIAVDAVSGDLLIGSATGDGLQQIPTRAP